MIKEKLKVEFVDFWPNFIKTDNYFYNLLSQKYDLTVTSEKQTFYFIPWTINKKEHMKFNDGKTIKIFYTGENFTSQTTESHAAFTFVENNDHRNSDYLMGITY